MYKLVYPEEDEVLNGLDTGDDLDGLALGELLRNCRPEGNNSEQVSGHGNRNTMNQEYRIVVETATLIIAETSVYRQKI